MELLLIVGAIWVVGVLIPRQGLTLTERAVDEPFASLLWGMFTFPLWGLAAVLIWANV